MRQVLIAALVFSSAAFAQIGGRGGIGPATGGTGGTGGSIAACNATPPTSGAANSTCYGTDGYLYQCSNGASACATAGQFVKQAGTGTFTALSGHATSTATGGATDVYPIYDVTVLPSAATAVAGRVYRMRAATTKDVCLTAGDSGGSAVAVCVVNYAGTAYNVINSDLVATVDFATPAQLSASVTGIRKSTGAGTTDTAAAAADVYGLWSGTKDSSHFMAGDGTMQAAATAATASTIAERNSSGELIAANTVATGKTPMATDTAVTAAQLTAGSTIVAQKFFGTTAPGSVSGNLPGDLYTDTTNHNEYVCNAPSGTATPACTSVSTAGWLLVNGGSSGGYATIENAGSAVTQQTTVNFIASGAATVNCVNNSGSSRTDCTIGATGGGTNNPAGSSGDGQTNNGSGAFGVMHLNDDGSTVAATEPLTGGHDASGNSAQGSVTLRGANQTGAGGSSSQGGSVLVSGGMNSATNAASVGGSVMIKAGNSTGATNTGLPGLLTTLEPYLQGTTVTQWNLQCMSAAMTVSDCGASPTSIVGVAFRLNTTVSAQVAVNESETPVNASAAVTVGHTVCAGTTAGKVTDSGGTLPCTAGRTIGIVLAIYGTWPAFPDGTAFPTLSNTLPLVKLGRYLTSTVINGTTCTPGSPCTSSVQRAAFQASFSSPALNQIQYGLPVPAGCTITGWSVQAVGGTSPTFTMDIWRHAYGTALPTISDTITASALPALASGNVLQSTAMTGWCGTGTCAVAQYDIFAAKITAISGSPTQASVAVYCQ